MTKNDLKTGMHVRTEDNAIYLVIQNIEGVDLLFVPLGDTQFKEIGFLTGDHYDDDLMYIGPDKEKSLSIMEVYLPHHHSGVFVPNQMLNPKFGKSIWVRPELTTMEKLEKLVNKGYKFTIEYGNSLMGTLIRPTEYEYVCSARDMEELINRVYKHIYN